MTGRTDVGRHKNRGGPGKTIHDRNDEKITSFLTKECVQRLYEVKSKRVKFVSKTNYEHETP